MIWIAFTMGLLGSLHCLGMCGPIALAIPVADPTPSKRILAVITYNIGRILVYSMFGLLAGMIGQNIALAGYQQVLSVVAGVLILLFLFTPLSKKIVSIQAFGMFKSMFGNLVKKKTPWSIFLLGVINGFLPCGMVYMALAGSVTTGDVLGGALFMAAFGAGTFPMMASISMMASLVSQKFRNTARSAFPYLMGAMALLLVLRGLDLGIPYISPKASAESGMHACCHKKSG